MTDFYTIPALTAPYKGSAIAKLATTTMSPVVIGTGRIQGGELVSGGAEVTYTDCKHGVFKAFKAETFAAAYFEAVLYAEQMAA